MEFIQGIPGNDLQQARDAGLDLVLLAARGANAVLKMVLIDGFFMLIRTRQRVLSAREPVGDHRLRHGGSH